MTKLTIGTRVWNSSLPVHLLAEKLNRHTFWCGQSGSGKTYALGVLLEQILVHTELPVLILDPNSDFVRLSEVRVDADPSDAEMLERTDTRVLYSTRDGGERLHASYLGLSVASRAAVLQLDPVLDAEEYNALLHTEVDPHVFKDADFLSALRASDHPGAGRLATRVENLQVLNWELWSRGGESATDIIHSRPRATVLDLGGFTHPDEPKVAALAMLEHLWATREDHRPVLIVIDEAHNLCPPDPRSQVERALTQQLIQIAAEGRKFGLWLLLSTQRPTKVHPNVLSQCDNLCVMRMNAPRDLAELGEVFGYAPEETLSAAQGFLQGQALFAGGFIDAPTVTQMGPRITEEGGVDVPVPMRSA
ncbi:MULTISPECIES: ATP-binding protein [unclassified Leucobacter]|uniref:ATP-binding protein n=1 Tax=unclassified Leucobacter TaxID=2621730 RepID=UPI00165E7FA9|nr:MULTISPECIES: ATP-binding protein [unclassified Leucobacter]MBC9935921.1 ATP-binding protein [Leucobacter sp. cx-87]